MKQRVDREVQDNTTLAQSEHLTIQQWQAIAMHRMHLLIRSMTNTFKESIQDKLAYTHYRLYAGTFLSGEWLLLVILL